ncbi:hypothetical protein BKA69DRAFT_1090331 [Paraphysoderma sedebokerense]|nr:hypothetical protein BKA69DRAFT_1090331 [Paraphysoderma sedebokerense]
MLWTLGISILRPRNIFRAHYDFSVPKPMDGQSHERAKRNEHRHQSSAASISAVAPTHTLPQPSPIHSVHSTRGDAVQYADNVQLRRLQVQERSPSTTFDWRASFESGVDRHPNVNPAGWFDRFIWVLHTTVATNALVIVIVVYCVLVFFWDGTEEGADPTPLWITIHVHGLNLVMMAIEISLSRFVWVWSHTFWPSMFMLLYLFFSWIYYGATGEYVKFFNSVPKRCF